MSVSARFRHWRALFGPFGVVIGSVYFVVGVLTFIRDNLLPPETRATWDTFKLLPHWPMSWWLVVGLLTLLISLLEASYRAAQWVPESYLPGLPPALDDLLKTLNA